MILILDNYDSFTYNLVHSIEDDDIQVIRNDLMEPEEAEKLNPTHLIISPGPGYPKDAGLSEKYIQYFKDKIPILGICLGHQAICEVFGGKIDHAKEIMHGMKDTVFLDKDLIFSELPETIEAGRYHSLALDPDSLPEELDVIAKTQDEEIMGVKHKDYPIWGLQFHPESILTPDGALILHNFINLTKGDN